MILLIDQWLTVEHERLDVYRELLTIDIYSTIDFPLIVDRGPWTTACIYG